MADVAIPGLPALAGAAVPDAALFEISDAGTSKRATRSQALNGYALTSHTHTIANVTGLQAALDARPDLTGTPLATNYPRWLDANTLEARTVAQVKADLDLEVGVDIPALSHTHTKANITDFGLSPFSNATGSQAAAATGQSWKLTGNVTAIPVTNGWLAKYVNTSGSGKSITPASGTCIKTTDGTTAASVTLANNKSCVVHADGTNLIVDGDVT